MLEEESIMKKIAVLTLAPVLVLAAAVTPALAQSGGTAAQGGTMTPNRQMQRPMSPVAGSSSETQLSAEQRRPDISNRKGTEQREMELVQTSLLNRFGGMGFAEMRNFRKISENYAAEVRTVEGVWVNILIDPVTGAVTVQQ